MIEQLAALGRWTLEKCAQVGRAGHFLYLALPLGWDLGPALHRVIKQIYNLGVLSLIIVLVAGLFVGMVLALQGYNILVGYGSEEALGQMVALSLLREFGPVVTALLFAGRAGSALTAEIGLMKTTDQLSAMEIMGVDPMRRIMAPRLWAGFIALPMLAMMFNLVGVYGGALVAVDVLGVYEGSYWANMQSAVDVRDDLLNGLIKAFVFGFVVSWIAVYHGWNSEPTSEGISRATTMTVVQGSLAVLGLDFVLTAVMLGGF